MSAALAGALPCPSLQKAKVSEEGKARKGTKEQREGKRKEKHSKRTKTVRAHAGPGHTPGLGGRRRGWGRAPPWGPRQEVVTLHNGPFVLVLAKNSAVPVGALRSHGPRGKVLGGFLCPGPSILQARPCPHGWHPLALPTAPSQTTSPCAPPAQCPKWFQSPGPGLKA